MKHFILVFLFLLCCIIRINANELIYIDNSGVIRWKNTKQEVVLFGANYCLPSACDFRAAEYVGGDRKQMIKEDLDHFKRMNWDALRLCFWGDYQNSDKNGNLIYNEHLDLLDYLIFEARKRDIFMLLSPIVTYNSQWPEMNDTTNIGFSKFYPKHTLIHDETAIEAQTNYIKQLLLHRNPYTGTCLKDESNILFVELINEPTQFPNDNTGMIKYINRMHDEIRSVGCNKLTFYNISQNFKVSSAISNSKVQGATYAWYPVGLNNGYSIQGNTLPFVDRYEQILNVGLDGKAKIVYEFDSPDLDNGYMLPAMVREFRRGGIQFAAIFSYDMLRTAPMNLGWGTHFFNMVYTPQKAVSGMIAAEVMRRVPRGKHYGYYPNNDNFDDFHLSYKKQLGELNTNDLFYYTNNTESFPKKINELKHIAGVGSSPVLEYDGTGVYFLDKLDDGVWQIEIYPDIMNFDDPFKGVNINRVSRQSVYNKRKLRVSLPDFRIEAQLYPGKYLFKNNKLISKSELSSSDFFRNEISSCKLINYTPAEFILNEKSIFSCELYTDVLPDSIELYITLKSKKIKRFAMKRENGFLYKADVDLTSFEKGNYSYYYVLKNKNKSLLFPDITSTTPDKWDFYRQNSYVFRLIDFETPLVLLDSSGQIDKVRRTRTYLSPEVNFNEVYVGSDYHKAFCLSVKDLESKKGYMYPCDATFSCFIGEKLKQRVNRVPSSVTIRAFGKDNTNLAICNFVDSNGRGLGVKFSLKSESTVVNIPITEFTSMKAVMLPQDWPGVNSYWYPNSIDKVSKDKFDWNEVEFVQISLRDDIYGKDNLGVKTIVVEDIILNYK